MTEHKHAAVLRAIADGVPVNDFEVHHEAWGQNNWESMTEWCKAVLLGQMQHVRRKQQYITVNGFKVPKPLDVMPERGTCVYSASTTSLDFAESSYAHSQFSDRAFNRSSLHITPEAAVAHAKAMLGIDPEA